MASATNNVHVWADGHSKVRALFDAEKLPECLKEARKFIADPAIPRYHHMLTLILLALILKDWEQAKRCYVRANGFWYIVRRQNPPGQNKEVDEAMDGIRKELDMVNEVLWEDQFAYLDDEVVEADEPSSCDPDVATTSERMEALHIDERPSVVIDTVEQENKR
jgi:hypothetical protein